MQSGFSKSYSAGGLNQAKSNNQEAKRQNQFQKQQNELEDASSDGNENNQKDPGELSDYIDENFELDETDELWGIQNKVNNCQNLNPHKNDIG